MTAKLLLMSDIHITEPGTQIIGLDPSDRFRRCLAHAAQHALPQAQAIAQFKQQSVEQQARFSDYKPAAQTPLGEAPLLALKVEMKVEMKDGKSGYAIDWTLAGGHQMQLTLDDDLFAKFRMLLATIQDRAQWGLGPASAVADGDPATADTQPGGTVLH